MGDFATMLKEFEETCAAIQIGGKICLIERFDKEKMRADVKPLGKRRVGENVVEWSIVSNVPVQFYFTESGEAIRPEYSRGDMVYVTWANRDIKGPLKGEDNDESITLFSAENASVVAAVLQTGKTPPSHFSNKGLLVGSAGAYTQYFNNQIKMGSANADESFVLGDAQRTELNNLKTQVDTLINILNSWVPVLLDGGTALKAIFTASGIVGFPPANFTNTLSDKLKGEK